MLAYLHVLAQDPRELQRLREENTVTAAKQVKVRKRSHQVANAIACSVLSILHHSYLTAPVPIALCVLVTVLCMTFAVDGATGTLRRIH